MYKANRRKRINLSSAQNKELVTVVETFDEYAYDEGLGTSQEDLTALARAYISKIELVTDDADLISVAKEFEVEVMNTLELLKLMLDKGRITIDMVNEVCEYLECIPDKPKNYYSDKQRLFGA